MEDADHTIQEQIVLIEFSRRMPCRKLDMMSWYRGQIEIRLTVARCRIRSYAFYDNLLCFHNRSLFHNYFTYSCLLIPVFH